MRAHVFRFAPENGHRAMQSACPFRAIFGSGATYSITSSAVASSAGGISRPRIFAVFRLIARLNLVGCSNGSSPGAAPSSRAYSIISSQRASIFLRWSFRQPGSPQSFFVSREAFGPPRAQHVFEIGNS
jgi:hypothetical protein